MGELIFLTKIYKLIIFKINKIPAQQGIKENPLA